MNSGSRADSSGPRASMSPPAASPVRAAAARRRRGHGPGQGAVHEDGRTGRDRGPARPFGAGVGGRRPRNDRRSSRRTRSGGRSTNYRVLGRGSSVSATNQSCSAVTGAPSSGELDMVRFQAEEIADAGFAVGDDKSLVVEADRLRNRRGVARRPCRWHRMHWPPSKLPQTPWDGRQASYAVWSATTRNSRALRSKPRSWSVGSMNSAGKWAWGWGKPRP